MIKGNFDRIRNAEERKEFRNFYELHKKDFSELSNMLEDNFSKETLQRVLIYRMTWKTKVLKGFIVEPQYFQKDIFHCINNEVFIDGGAYVGDTIENFIQYFCEGGYTYKHIYAWEPDCINIKQMEKRLNKYNNISIVPVGMWNKKTQLMFSQNGNAGSMISEKGLCKINVDSIDNMHLNEKITFIKMDIEGSEKKALQGARQTIQRDKPRLAICIYHSPEDLYEIPLMIKEMVPEYKLYIRHHSDTFAETVVYATL